jgi:hypothetical protein
MYSHSGPSWPILGRTLPLPLLCFLCAIIIIFLFNRMTSWTGLNWNTPLPKTCFFYVLENGALCIFRSLGCFICQQKHVLYLIVAYPIDFLFLISLSVHIINNRTDYIFHLLLLLLFLFFVVVVQCRPWKFPWKSVQTFSFLAHVKKTYCRPRRGDLFIRLNWSFFQRQNIEIERGERTVISDVFSGTRI